MFQQGAIAARVDALCPTHRQSLGGIALVSNVIAAAKTFMTKELGLAGDVLAVESANDGWVATVEAIQVDPELRRIARKDLVVAFELRFNSELQVQSFARKGMRERGSIT